MEIGIDNKLVTNVNTFYNYWLLLCIFVCIITLLLFFYVLKKHFKKMKKKKDVITRKKYIACILFESIFIYVYVFLFFSTLQMNFFFTEAGRKVQNLNPNPITIKKIGRAHV